MRITAERVAEEHEWIRQREVVLDLLNTTRTQLGEIFDTTVEQVSPETYRNGVDAVFTDGAVAVNVTAYVKILRDLDVSHDYPGFVVDEVIGRRLAATIAGGEPLATLAMATFHVIDAGWDGPTGRNGEPAGADDLDAALAAGFQTRLPGWGWREADPFGVTRSDPG